MAQDILIDDTGDLVIENGDFKIGDSDMQHAALLINTFLGAWKQHPLAGVGILQYSASSGQTAQLRRDILEQMEQDGFVNVEVLISGNDTDTFDYYVTGERLE